MDKLKRVILKISGECLSGVAKTGLDSEAMHFIAKEMAEAKKESNVQLAVVVGGGNLIRGARLTRELKTTPVIGDQAGMLATIVNGILLQDFLEHEYNTEARVLSAVEVKEFAEPYIRRRAIQHLLKDRIVICTAGTGNPRFSTDTAAVLRAVELEADIVIKGTKVDGVYDRDPNEDKDAKFIEEINYKDFVQKGLRIADRTAITLAGENDINVRVFNIFIKGNLKKILSGEKIGSLISAQD